MEKNGCDIDESTLDFDDDVEFDQDNDEETAEKIELLVRCVHAARLSGA